MTSLFEPKLFAGTRVYLSGPMDFVASRADEKVHGWRHRVSDFLRALGVTVLDPWFKPEVRGFHEYGREGESTTTDRARWSFDPSEAGAEARAYCVAKYHQTQHIDLRMVDTSDFVVSFCPTNIYSVGTPHEIVLCRQQHKPVLFVSPSVTFPAVDRLRSHLTSRGDEEGFRLLSEVELEVPIKPNPDGIPSLWYMPLVGGDTFFDGFGFATYQSEFAWPDIALDEIERSKPPRRPLLPFLEQANERLPQKWDSESKTWIDNDDWILWDFASSGDPGAQLKGT